MVKQIRIEKIDDLKRFVNTASKCDFDVLVSSGYYHVDGKSLMGMIAVNTADKDGVTVSYNAHNKDFDAVISEFEI